MIIILLKTFCLKALYLQAWLSLMLLVRSPPTVRSPLEVAVAQPKLSRYAALEPPPGGFLIQIMIPMHILSQRGDLIYKIAGDTLIEQPG
jgi:hypothetical protein